MKNESAVLTGERIAWAYDDLYYLERACMHQVLVQSTGQPLAPVQPELAARVAARRWASARSRTCSGGIAAHAALRLRGPLERRALQRVEQGPPRLARGEAVARLEDHVARARAPPCRPAAGHPGRAYRADDGAGFGGDALRADASGSLTAALQPWTGV